MKRRPFVLFSMLALMAALGLTGCSRTVEDVASWKSKGNISKLIKALGDPKVEVRLTATEALGELKAEPAVDSLAALYNDPEDSIILAAVDALAAIGTKSTTTPMIAALKLDFPQARKTAAIKLGELKAVGAVKQLGEALNDSEAEVQLSAAASLGHIADESGSEALVGKLGDSSIELRKMCVEALGKTGGVAAAKGLIGALADNNAAVSKAAIVALVELGKTSVPFALEGLRSEKQPVRAGSINVLRKLEAIPDAGKDLVWYQLARVSIDSDDTMNDGVVQTLYKLGESAIDPLLEAAAHPVLDIREHATLALERFGKAATEKALAAAEKADSEAKNWMDGRKTWSGSPSWLLDLWAATAALNPDFNLDNTTVDSLKLQARPAFNIIVSPKFKPGREYIPLLIALLGDETKPPPEQPDYDAEGIPVVKDQRDMFRGEANQQTAKKKLVESGHLSTFPLIAAIEDPNELIAGHAADILGGRGEKRALRPLMKIVSKKIDAEEILTDSPFYIALQKMDEPIAEPLLLKVRPNPDRAMTVFHRKYPDIRPLSAETKDYTVHHTLPIKFRIGYIKNAQIAEMEVIFIKDDSEDWRPSPPLPEQAP